MQSGDFKYLIQSIMDEDFSTIDYYLADGADVNFLHPEIMTTPLIEAVRLGNVEITTTLLEKGANPKLESMIGESPMKLAKQSKNKVLISLLKEANRSSSTSRSFFRR